MKVQIINNVMNTHNCKVFIDGHDVTRNLTEIDVKIKADEIPTLKLAFYPDDIEIEGDFEVLKKLPSEECGTEIAINNNKVTTEVKVEALAKAIISNFNRSSYR